MSSHAAAIAALGFPEPADTGGLRSVAHLFGSSKPRCGIYLLVLPEDRFYIGQAVDVVRRYAQHAKAHEHIDAFAFIPTPRAGLNDRERELIFRAEAADLTLMNVVHVADIVGESDLEALLPAVALEEWLTDPFGENEKDFATEPIRLPAKHQARFEKNVRRFEQHPLHRAALLQLFLYLESAVPYPRLTEYSFWSVSCMPSTNAQGWPRLLCVSQSVMEVFCVGYYKDPSLSGGTWGFMNVASDKLFSEFGSEAAFSAAHPEVELRRSKYRDGGQHQVSLMTSIQDDMVALLTDDRVTKAAATLSLRLMRRRPTIYYKFHAPQLVDQAMRYRQSSQEEFGNELSAILLQDDGAPTSEVPADTGKGCTASSPK